MTVVIGLTGPIGCGKSTIAGWLREAGATIVDGDRVAREVVEPGEPAFDAVVASFGDAVLRPDGTLDRAALGRIVFADPGQLARLESIVHPVVRPRIVAAVDEAQRRGAPAVVVEAIKLIEGGLAETCDETWIVMCTGEEQLRRMVGRGSTAGEASLRISAQADFVAMLPAATRVIDTSGAPAGTRDRVLETYRACLAAHSSP